jgi:hypothetical protein
MALSRGMKRWLVASALVSGLVSSLLVGLNPGDPIPMKTAWSMHQIVAGVAGTGNPDGADGVDWSDVDGDGLLDVATGHEQGLRGTLAFNPGPTAVETADWPHVTLPTSNLCAIEDVVIGDVDGDGAKDLVFACDALIVGASICFSPAPPNTRSELLNDANWNCVNITAAAGNRHMRAVVADIAGDSAMEIITGGKESSGPCVAAAVGYYSNATPTNQASWASATFTSLNPAGWVMNMYVQDLDGDTFVDIVYSDREPIDCPTPGGGNQGITVLKATSKGVFAAPVVHLAGEGDHKWFTLTDWDGDTDLDIVDCRSTALLNTSQVLLNGGSFNSFGTTIEIEQPANVGQCQHVCANDVDEDGAATKDLVFSYSNAQGLSAMAWLRGGGTPLSPTFTRGEISGVLDADSDVKMDNLRCDIDIDGDGDDDVSSTEQHVPAGTGPGLGVLYFESPLHSFTELASSDVSCTLLTAGSNTTDANNFNVASISPTANRPLYLVVQSAQGTGPNAPAVDGTAMGLTWVQERTVAYSTRRLTVLRALGASPVAGAPNITFGGQTQTSAIWQIVECEGADTGGTSASEATPQSASATVAAGTTLTATLPGALNGSTSRLLCWVGLDIASSVTPDADLLEFSDASVAAGASTLEGQGALDQTACTPTFSSANAGAIVIEVKAP